MIDIPDKFKRFVNDQNMHLLQIHDTKGLNFKNQDNHDLFTVIDEIYSSDDKVNLEDFKKQYPNLKIDWEALAAIGAATGTMELIKYAYNHKGGRLSMCTALENLKKEGMEEGLEKGTIYLFLHPR